MSKLVCTYRNFWGRRGARNWTVEATIVGNNVTGLLGLGVEEARTEVLNITRLEWKAKLKK